MMTEQEMQNAALVLRRSPLFEPLMESFLRQHFNLWLTSAGVSAREEIHAKALGVIALRETINNLADAAAAAQNAKG